MLVEPGRRTTESEQPIGRFSQRLLDPQSVHPTRPRAFLRRRLPRWAVRALAVYLASRLVVAVAALMAVGVGAPAHREWWWERWDSFWYLEIARHGYPDVVAPFSPDRPYSPFAFFPLWPMLVRGTSTLLGGHPVLAAYLLNLVLGGVLILLVRVLFARASDERTADVGVLLFAFFPGTNVFSAAYSEPLALCLAAGALIALQRRSWLVAGVLASLAGATRPPIALAVVAAICWVVVAALRRREWRSLLALGLAPLGPLAFVVYGWRRTGRPLAWHEAEKTFGNRIDFGQSFVRDVSRPILADVRAPETGLAVLVYLSIAVLLVLAVFFVRRPPQAMLVVYTVAALVFPATTSALMPKVRFQAAGFPLLLPLARWLGQRGRETVLGIVIGVESALLVGFTMMHLLSRLAFP